MERRQINPPCIIPVRASDALLWWQGKLTDRDLFFSPSTARPESIFIAWLPDRASYARALRLVAHWRERGAFTLIMRTGAESVARHMLRAGGLPGLCEGGGKIRYIAPPDKFAVWTARFMKTTSPAAITATLIEWRGR